MLDWGEFAPRRDGAGYGLGALNDTHVNDPSGGRFGMARCLGSADNVGGSGRRVCVAWTNAGVGLGTPDATSFNTQSLPRELAVDGSRLVQRFARELRGLRRSRAAASAPGAFPGGPRVEVRATFGAAAAGRVGVEVLGGSEIFVDVDRGLACCDASRQGNAEPRCGPLRVDGDAAAARTIHAIVDHSIIEVIVDGATAITCVANPPVGADDDVRVFAPPGVAVDAEIWALAAAASSPLGA